MKHYFLKLTLAIVTGLGLLTVASESPVWAKVSAVLAMLAAWLWVSRLEH